MVLSGLWAGSVKFCRFMPASPCRLHQRIGVLHSWDCFPRLDRLGPIHHVHSAVRPLVRLFFTEIATAFQSPYQPAIQNSLTGFATLWAAKIGTEQRPCLSSWLHRSLRFGGITGVALGPGPPFDIHVPRHLLRCRAFSLIVYGGRPSSSWFDRFITGSPSSRAGC